MKFNIIIFIIIIIIIIIIIFINVNSWLYRYVELYHTMLYYILCYIIILKLDLIGLG